MEVVKKKSRVRYVEGIVGVREVEGVANFDSGAGSERRGERGIQPGTAVSYGNRVEVYTDRLDLDPELAAALEEMDKVISAPTADIEDLKTVAALHQRIESAVRGSVAAQEPINPPQGS